MANLSIAPTAISPRAAVAISGFVDHHTHLLKEAAGTPFPWQGPPSAPFMSRYGATARPPWTCRSPRPVSHSKKERKACTAAWAAPPRNFDDEDSAGILFQDSSTLARRIEPFAATGWRIATHAIGDRAVEAVLDAYDMAWGADRHAISAAMPRIEHGSVLPEELANRIAAMGVAVCIQPSFPVTDAAQGPVALGAGRAPAAYPWARLADRGVRLLAGSDFPIEVIEPLVGLARLVNGRSDRPGFADAGTAAAQSRLPVRLAVELCTDQAAGQTFLSAGPVRVPAADLDLIEVRGTEPAPFS